MTPLEKRLTVAIEDFVMGKFEKTNTKRSYIPFLEALIGKARVRRYSLTHSISTTMGALYEDIALVLCADRFDDCIKQYRTPQKISKLAHDRIEQILLDLEDHRETADHLSEIAQIREVAKEGGIVQIRTPFTDLYLRDSNIVYLVASS